jgi:hypothetical protein
MAKVIARIIIDTEDLDQGTTIGDLPVVQWKRVETLHAHPFSELELNSGSGFLGDLFYL